MHTVSAPKAILLSILVHLWGGNCSVGLPASGKPQCQLTSTCWRATKAGELEVGGGPLEEILPSDYAVSYSRSEMSVKSSGGHTELNKNRLDEGGAGNGLSRLNPYVPRIAGATLSNQRCIFIFGT